MNLFFVFLGLIRVVVIVVSFPWVVCAIESELAFSRNARTFEGQPDSLVIKSLAFSCLTLTEVPDSLPCNPAMTGKASKGSLKATSLIANGYSNLDKTRRLFKSDIDQSLVNDLFSDQPVLQSEANISLMFTSPLLNSRFSPISYKYFSVVRNEANPDAEIYAVDEQELTVQSGFQYKNFDFGIEIRRVEWKFIRQRIKLLALSTQQGLDSIKPKSQTAYLIQPGINYNINTTAWPIRFAVKLVNSGFFSELYDDFQHPLETQFGLGVSPTLPFGSLDVMIDYKSLIYTENDSEKVHLGILYRYGTMNVGFGLDNNGSSVGVFYGIEQINAGILFSSTQLPWKSEDYLAQTVYVQIGWQL